LKGEELLRSRTLAMPAFIGGRSRSSRATFGPSGHGFQLALIRQQGKNATARGIGDRVEYALSNHVRQCTHARVQASRNILWYGIPRAGPFPLVGLLSTRHSHCREFRRLVSLSKAGLRPAGLSSPLWREYCLPLPQKLAGYGHETGFGEKVK